MVLSYVAVNTAFFMAGKEEWSGSREWYARSLRPASLGLRLRPKPAGSLLRVGCSELMSPGSMEPFWDQMHQLMDLQLYTSDGHPVCNFCTVNADMIATNLLANQTGVQRKYPLANECSKADADDPNKYYTPVDISLSLQYWIEVLRRCDGLPAEGKKLDEWAQQHWNGCRGAPLDGMSWASRRSEVRSGPVPWPHLCHGRIYSESLWKH